MAETDRLQIEVDDRCGSGRLEKVEIQLSSRDDAAGAQNFADVVAVVESGDNQEQAGLGRQIGHPVGERALEPCREWEQLWLRHGTLEARGGDRELDQRQRVAGGLLQDPVALRQAKLLRRSVEQLRGHRRVKGGEPALRQPGICEHRRIAVTDGGQQHDRVGVQPACDEGEHVSCRAIEPVGVLGDQQQRRVAGDLREEVERGHGDTKMLGCGPVCEPERGVERLPLSRDQVRRAVFDRPQQLMQTREGQTRLRLNAGRAQHGDPAIARDGRRLSQQT